MHEEIRPEIVAGLLAALRERRPNILSLSRHRSGVISRVLRALGATMITSMSKDVSRSISGVDVLVVSPIIADAAARRKMEVAMAAARQQGVPVVIDLTGLLKRRRAIRQVRRTIASAVWPVITASTAELGAFTKPTGRAIDPVGLAATILRSGGLAAIRGLTGTVTDGKRSVRIDPWHRWLHTAHEAGPLAGASIAAFLGVAHYADFITVTAAALACLGEAAVRASRTAKPHAMQPHVIKELAAMSARGTVRR